MFCDRLGAARSLIAHLAAMSAVLIWLDAIWPGLVNGEIRFLALAMFGANLILAVGVVTEEIIWRVRRKRCLDADQDGGP